MTPLRALAIGAGALAIGGLGFAGATSSISESPGG